MNLAAPVKIEGLAAASQVRWVLGQRSGERRYRARADEHCLFVLKLSGF